MCDYRNQAWFKNLLQDADWVGVRHINQKSIIRSVMNDRPDQAKTHFEKGLMFEILLDGHIGYGGTNDLSQNGITHCFHQARALTLQSAKAKAFSFDPNKVRPAYKGDYATPKNSLGTSSSQILRPEGIVDLLLQATRAMSKSGEISARSAYLQFIERDQTYISSSGAEIHQKFSNIGTHLQARATRGGETQSRSDRGFMATTYQMGLEDFNQSDFIQRANILSEEALELLSAANCPTQSGDLLIAPDQMVLQIHESIGHPLELDRILGDERNYAGWSFVKPSDFGSLQYGSSLMNVVFDPNQELASANFAFDDTGTPAQREFLIKDGILVRGIGGHESQSRSQIPGTAAARSTSWNRPPIDRMGNINLVPGKSSLAEMIESVDNGILMFSNRSWSIDDHRNKFQFGCEYAKRIVNGKLGQTLKNPNYRGQTVPFWRRLKMLGNSESAETLGAAFCGKGEPNQAITVGHRSPFCLFSEVDIFGGVT